MASAMFSFNYNASSMARDVLIPVMADINLLKASVEAAVGQGSAGCRGNLLSTFESNVAFLELKIGTISETGKDMTVVTERLRIVKAILKDIRATSLTEEADISHDDDGDKDKRGRKKGKAFLLMPCSNTSLTFPVLTLPPTWFCAGEKISEIRITTDELKLALRYMVDGVGGTKAAKLACPRLPAAYGSVYRYWKGTKNKAGTSVRKGIEEHTGFNEAETKAARLLAIDQLTSLSLGNPEFASQTFFTSTEFDVFSSSIAAFGDFGFPYTADTFKYMAQQVARRKLENDVNLGRRESFIDELESQGGDIPDCSRTFFAK